MEHRRSAPAGPARAPSPRAWQLPPAAPSEAKAMALLAEWSHRPAGLERLLDTFVQVEEWAAGYRAKPLRIHPELQALVDLQGSLPPSLQSAAVHPAMAPAVAGGTLVDVQLKAMTPVLQSPLPFAKALEIADVPRQWPESSPQMCWVADAPLPANGALWRHSLTKRTDFGTPLVGGLATEETIHITAEGSTAPDGKSGHRRYTHVLDACRTGADLVEVVKDSGWIELRGDDTGIQLQIQKEVTVRRPAGDPFAAILSAGFGAELWLWAMGFFAAGGAPHQSTPVKTPVALPPRDKELAAAGPGPRKVAVLGGGPAGLACAWLLSRPEDPANQGKFAWDHDDTSFKLEVTLVEKSCIPGGKAASARRKDNEASRVEEHGLHVLMGCYANVLQVMRWTGGAAHLEEFGTTHLPSTTSGSLDDLWSLDAGPWPATPELKSLASWSDGVDLTECEAIAALPQPLFERSRPLWFDLSEATLNARPLFRAFSTLAPPLAKAGRKAGTVPRTSLDLQRLVLPWVGARLMKAIALRTAYLVKGDPNAADATQLAPLARLMRELARSALVPDPADPSVAEVREWVELATTVAIGLDDAGLFPAWALDDPQKLLDSAYPEWVRAMQALDTDSLEAWLVNNGIESGFVANSRILASLTAALFTTPAGIAAGTFLHGMARLLLTYEGKPYRRMKGGTGEAFVAPIFNRLLKSGASVHTGATADSLEAGPFGDIARVKATQRQQADPAEFGAHVGGRLGWLTPPAAQDVDTGFEVAADAFVLAIPPYAQVLPGTPDALRADLQKIRSCATVSLQCWADLQAQARFPDSIVSATPGPLRCAAHMTGLDEGASFGVPLYACGDVEEAAAHDWAADDTLRDGWLANYRPMLQAGAPGAQFKKVNDTASDRYTCADPDTQAARRFGYDTGVKNLWLAGDWTRTALSCGSIEAAVTSGLEAANDILTLLGCKVNFPIVGRLY